MIAPRGKRLDLFVRRGGEDKMTEISRIQQGGRVLFPPFHTQFQAIFIQLAGFSRETTPGRAGAPRTL